jgi:CBS domain-containing protein
VRVSDVLRTKGAEVVTVKPTATVREFVEVLASRRIGACVVSADGRGADGMISELDIAKGLAARGAALLDEPVSAICTSLVLTAAPDNTLDELMRAMTENRVRHMPVVVDGALIGLISIGDVVKHRIDELESEKQHLVEYISSAG